MPDRDLLEIFDAVLPRLECFAPGSVPPAGSAEATGHENRRSAQRAELAMYSAATVAGGVISWFFWGPWLPLWFLIAMATPAAVAGLATLRSFLKLAFGPPLQQALPAGTDAATAQLEDGTWNSIRWWNYDAFIWNGRVDALRADVAEWQRLKDVPEARGIEWSERGSMTRAEGLIAEMQGLAADRAALVAQRQEIEHRIRTLEGRLLQLEAEESPTLALPPPSSEDPTDPG